MTQPSTTQDLDPYFDSTDWWSRWTAVVVTTRLETLREFGADVEAWSTQESKRFEQHIVKSAASIPDNDEREQYLEVHEETFLRYEREYPQLSRELIWVKANFILEAELTDIARWIEKAQNITLSFDEYKESYKNSSNKKGSNKKGRNRNKKGSNKKGSNKMSAVGQAALYIRNHGGVSIPCPQLVVANGASPEHVAIWSDMEAIRVVRNAIVHEAGVLKSGDVLALKASRLEPLVALDSDKKLSFPTPIHDQIVSSLHALFASITTGLKP